MVSRKVYYGYIEKYKVWFPTKLYTLNHGGWRLKTQIALDCSSKRKFRRMLKRASFYLPPGEKFVLYLSDQIIEGTTT